MAKRLIFLIFIIQFSLVLAQVQVQSLKAITLSIQKINADDVIGVDGLDNMFYIKNNTLFKKSNTESWQYENIYMGKITRVDIQNPLKIVLFYENFNTIIILDNQLNEIQKINFSENTIPIIVSATGIASQNRLWIYDSTSQQIGLYDYLKKTFTPVTTSFQGNFKYYNSDFNTFQWVDDKLNWYSCDIYGKIKTLGKVSDFEQIKPIINYAVIFSKKGKLYLQDVNKNSVYVIENIEKSFKNFYYKDQILSIFTNKEITNYKITIP